MRHVSVVYDSTPVKRSLVGQRCPGAIKTGEMPLDLRSWQSKWGLRVMCLHSLKAVSQSVTPDLNNASAQTPNAAAGSQRPSWWPSACLCGAGPHSVPYMWSAAPFVVSWDKAELRSCDRDVWPRNPKIFTIWHFTGSVCQALNQVTFVFGAAVPLELGLTWVLVGRTVRDHRGRVLLRHLLRHLSHVPCHIPTQSNSLWTIVTAPQLSLCM